ncbi:MAG TPA: biliverdin-producing heme oxygenase [Kofleriaceae bacterium]|nr:biliverdin-producing heme oxygenase [Kofleriaceae bacterium]
MASRTPTSPLPALTTQLREATATLRDDRELLAGRVTPADYRTYLLRMYGFHANVERALKSCRPLAAVVADAPLRNHKAALIAHDLIALGVEHCELVTSPRMTFPGALALPEALGWTYAVEAIAFGGKQLARHLARQLPAELARASAYLGCYGGEAAERWRELGERLDGFEHAVRDADRVVAAARDGFTQLRAWVRPALQPRSSRIHA